MIENGYHEKRKDERRKTDMDRDFLIKIIKTCLRMRDVDTIKETLAQTVDFVENGERLIKGEI